MSALAMAVAFEGLLLAAASGQPLAISGHGEALFPVAKVRKPEPISQLAYVRSSRCHPGFAAAS